MHRFQSTESLSIPDQGGICCMPDVVCFPQANPGIARQGSGESPGNCRRLRRSSALFLDLTGIA